MSPEVTAAVEVNGVGLEGEICFLASAVKAVSEVSTELRAERGG